MADHKDCMPLEPESIRKAHATIERYIHRTPLLTSRTLDRLVSTPSSIDKPAPRLRLYFKCENYQKIGAFKARGAFHALSHLIELLGEDEVRKRGVVTHSSGALAPIIPGPLALTVAHCRQSRPGFGTGSFHL